MSKIKLKDILSEAFEDSPRVDKRQTVEGVRNYGIVGKSLYNNGNIMEIAKQLSEAFDDHAELCVQGMA